MSVFKKLVCLLPLLVVFYQGHCLSVIPDPPILDCRVVLCALPDCPNPIPANPSIGKCCPTCPPTDPLKCPKVPPGTFGLCVERCSGDEDCPSGQLCCSNGCGHECRVGVPDVCRYNGQVYRPGDSFPSTDGCNTCFCSSGGLVGCTKIACPQFCVRDGVRYKIGQEFPAGDGCNTCTCLAGGDIACTEIACACPVKGQVFKDCGSACPPNCTNPTPICTRQCVARCECPTGQVIDEKKNECVPVDQCPVGTCERGGVTYQVGDSFPAGDGCNNCECIRPNVIVCTLIACPEPPTCPPDKPLVNCFVDPCMFATCPNHRNARCVADYCGGCNARFFEGEEEVTDTCRTCPVKGQVFKDCASACPPNCTNPTPICTRQCVARCECPTGQVIDEKKNECVPVDQCPANCPPTCTPDFCRYKWGSKCTIPGPREIPGCTGQCQFTYCSACYFSAEPRPLPGSCRTCGGPISSQRCYKRWARCIGFANYREHGQTPADEQTDENFRCYRYPCPLRG